MKNLLISVLLCVIATPVMAQVGQGLDGPYYNLNIIGVPKGKTADMTGNDGNWIFVPLNKAGELDGKVKMFFVAGETFTVLDANGTDHDGATIEVPHGDSGTVCFDAFATAPGKPGGIDHTVANVIFDETVDTDLLYLDQVEFDAYRGKNKPNRQNICDIFRVSGCIDVNDNGMCDAKDETFDREWVFNLDELQGYWWDYYNYDLKLLQIRFYDCSQVLITPDPSISLKSMAQTETTSWGAMKSLYK